MAYGRRGGTPRSKKGHTAHTRMGLPRGNPMAKGGNFRRGGMPRGRGRTPSLSMGGRRRY